MSTQDGRIAEEFRLKQSGRVPSGNIIEIETSVAVGTKIDIEAFSNAIETKLWESVGRANWRPLDQAIKFVHRLRLKSGTEWLAYCDGKRNDLPKRPPDIPVYPDQLYAKSFAKEGVGAGGWAPVPSQPKTVPTGRTTRP